MESSDIKKMKDLEDENHLLKQMLTDLSLEYRALKDVIEKSFKTSEDGIVPYHCVLDIAGHPQLFGGRSSQHFFEWPHLLCSSSVCITGLLDIHHGRNPPSVKNPPVGPETSKVAYLTTISAA